MHEIIFYKNTKGRQPVLEYMQELSESNSKDSRIKLNKVNDYIQALSVYGTEELSENYVKLCKTLGRGHMGTSTSQR